MSSDYRILCLSHDPAIVTGEDYMVWNNAEYALAAIRDRSGPAALHKDCDLLVGRYSSPLVEVCCPGYETSGRRHGHPGSHSDHRWIGADWLRLLAGTPASPAAFLDLCWSRDRALRLRVELGVDEPTVTP